MLCLKGKISRKILVTLIFQEDVIANIKMYKILYIKENNGLFYKYLWVHPGHYESIILDIEWNQKPCYFIWHSYLVTQWLKKGGWFIPCTPMATTNKTDIHEISTEIWLTVVVNTYEHNLFHLYLSTSFVCMILLELFQ